MVWNILLNIVALWYFLRWWEKRTCLQISWCHPRPLGSQGSHFTRNLLGRVLAIIPALISNGDVTMLQIKITLYLPLQMDWNLPLQESRSHGYDDCLCRWGRFFWVSALVEFELNTNYSTESPSWITMLFGRIQSCSEFCLAYAATMLTLLDLLPQFGLLFCTEDLGLCRIPSMSLLWFPAYLYHQRSHRNHDDWCPKPASFATKLPVCHLLWKACLKHMFPSDWCNPAEYVVDKWM